MNKWLTAQGNSRSHIWRNHPETWPDVRSLCGARARRKALWVDQKLHCKNCTRVLDSQEQK